MDTKVTSPITLEAAESPDTNDVRRFNKSVVLGVSVFALASYTYGFLQVRADPVLGGRILSYTRSFNPLPKEISLDEKGEMLDPPLGVMLPDGPIGKAIRTSVKYNKRGYLIAWIGDCASCNSFDNKKWESEYATSGIPLIYLSSGSPVDTAKFSKSIKSTVPVIHDPTRRFSQAIKMYFAGRVLYYDKDWKLRWQMTGIATSATYAQLLDLQMIVSRER